MCFFLQEINQKQAWAYTCNPVIILVGLFFNAQIILVGLTR